MRWKEGRRSENVEDRRGITPAGIAIGGGIGTLLLALAAIFLGADPRQVLNALQQQQQQAAGGPSQADMRQRSPEEEERVDFVKVVLADTEDVWTDIFQQEGQAVPEAEAGDLSSARSSRLAGWRARPSGPFYCPADSKVYIDLSFFKELENKFKAPGDLPRLTWSPTRSAITFRTCWESANRCTRSRAG